MDFESQSNMRIIDKASQKIKTFVRYRFFDDVIWICIIMFMGIGAFFLGILYERGQYRAEHPVEVTYSEDALELWETYQTIKYENQEYFASKNGSVVYPVGCTKGARILEENKVFFQNIDQALAQGYREASGC